jgi:hypothetical protein
VNEAITDYPDMNEAITDYTDFADLVGVDVFYKGRNSISFTREGIPYLRETAGSERYARYGIPHR